eukprot:6201683-Pleurochrysis_carterae.AAC.2
MSSGKSNVRRYSEICVRTSAAFSRRANAHFQVSLPSFRSTWRRSTIQCSSGAEVNGMPSGPGGVPRCLRLWEETNAASFFIPASVSSARSAASFASNAANSARSRPGSRAKSQQSHARICPQG